MEKIRIGELIKGQLPTEEQQARLNDLQQRFDVYQSYNFICPQYMFEPSHSLPIEFINQDNTHYEQSKRIDHLLDPAFHFT